MKQETIGAILGWGEKFDVVLELENFGDGDEIEEKPTEIYIMDDNRVIDSCGYTTWSPFDWDFLNKAAWLIATSNGELTTVKLGPIDDSIENHFSIKACRASIRDDGMVIDEEDLFEIV
jgi:hypothetical protein